MTTVVLVFYSAVLFLLMLYGFHRYWILFLYWKFYKKEFFSQPQNLTTSHPLPLVTVQLPLYNEMYVAERLIEKVSQLDYPKSHLEIQVLDDSTDDTVALVAKKVATLRQRGYNIHHVRREHRSGYKAGALAHGLKLCQGTFVAIFDADFLPPAGFLKATLPYFEDSAVGMVQTRWGHLNAGYSLLTRIQALFLDGHFLLEHTARYKSGALFNFNGTAGIWRKATIEAAGGWSARTLTEDLDLSYRAQLAGWKFVYVPDFVCPAELPVDIHAFLSQQRRWTKGALQVARYLLKDVWTSALPLHTKVEATVHLTSNIGYILTAVVVLLLLPSVYLRATLNGPVEILEILVFLVTTVSIGTFYFVSQKELYPDWKNRIKDIPALMAFGIGICISNAKAVIEGLFNFQSEFVRTPKYNIQNKADVWSEKAYAKSKKSRGLVFGVLVFYSAVSIVVAVSIQQWSAVPFMLLFVFGFSYVLALSLKHRPR